MPKQRKSHGSKWQSLIQPGPGQGVVIGYVRYSTLMQDPRSLEEQKDRITAKAASYHWKVVGFVEEPETTASFDDLDSRPGFKKLLLEDAGKTCNVVVCDETSRWARSAEIGHMSLRLLRERGCWWETASDGWDINKPLTDGGSVMWAITQGQNEDYSRKISYHSKKGKTGKAKEGYSNGRPVYGYQAPHVHVDSTTTALDTKRIRRRLVYEPDPRFFPGLQKLGKLAAQQQPVLSYAAIARELNRIGPPYYNATQRVTSDWTSERISALLRSVYPREFAPGGGKGTVSLPACSSVAL